jgi:hypothetical protein
MENTRLRSSLRLRPIGLVATLAVATVGVAQAAAPRHTAAALMEVRMTRAHVDQYRMLTWTYERAAGVHRTRTAYTYRRSNDRAYLQWTLRSWQTRANQAQARALAGIRRRLSLRLPATPSLRASLRRQIAYDRLVTLELRRVYPGQVTRSFASARAPDGPHTLTIWQRRAALATLQISRHSGKLIQAGPRWLTDAFLCIHRYEGAWTSNSGNGYYGGLQMDRTFMRHYGSAYVRLWGTADHWPAWAQMQVSVRAYRAGRGFWPWPRTARACGLL